MKQSDIFTIVLIAVAGTAAAYFGLNAILGDPNDKSVTFKTITPVTATLDEPDPEVFNVDAINPTIEVYVGACEDVDRNGILDIAELVACGQVEEEVTVPEDGTEGESTEVQTSPYGGGQLNGGV